MTVENMTYGGEQVPCSNCGLISLDLVGKPPRCPTVQRCDAVKRGMSLGGKIWSTKKVSYELNAEEIASIREAVLTWQEWHAEEAAEGAILLTAILDEAVKSGAETYFCISCSEGPFSSPQEVLLHREKHHKLSA